MAIGDISLTASARQNLLALQNSAKLLSTTQAHLSSGKKVNSALDNASSYFASQGFLNSANDLAGLKDSMATALQTIKAASDAITSIKNIVTQLQGVANSAAQSQDSTTREGYAVQYNSLMTQLDYLANDATFNGTNLVNSLVSQLKVVFNATNTTYLLVDGQNLRTGGLGIGAAQHGWEADTLAMWTTNTMTVTSTTANVTGAYTGSLDMTENVASVTATDGVGAVITSTAADFSTTAALTDGGTVAILDANSLLNGDADFLKTRLDVGLSFTAGHEMAAGTDISAVTIQGQFTATGSNTATYTLASNTITTVADNDITISIAAGEAIQVNYTQGGTAYHATYANQGTTAVSITLRTTDTATVGANGTANSTATYNLSTGTISYTGLELAEGYTIAGSQIVDAGDATVGMEATVYSTADGTGYSQGTTTASGVTAYDTSSATLSAITVTDVVATKTGTASVTYALAAGSTLTASNATQLTGSSTIVVADSLLTAQNQLTQALQTLRTAGASLGNNNTLVQTRQEFTNNLINTLQTASDNLILADTNEEGANMQALQAQNQLGIISLGISGQLAQAILKLF